MVGRGGWWLVGVVGGVTILFKRNLTYIKVPPFISERMCGWYCMSPET